MNFASESSQEKVTLKYVKDGSKALGLFNTSPLDNYVLFVRSYDIFILYPNFHEEIDCCLANLLEHHFT